MDGRLVKENSTRGANARSAAELEDVPAAVWPVAGENRGGGGSGGSDAGETVIFNIADFLPNRFKLEMAGNVSSNNCIGLLAAAFNNQTKLD